MNHLIAVTGLIPYTITQALWCWKRRGITFDAITIITTSKGKERIDNGWDDVINGATEVFPPLLGPKGVFDLFTNEYRVKLPIPNVILFEDKNGYPLPDVLKKDDFESAAMLIYRTIVNIKKNTKDTIYCIYSGGRRVMATYLASALMMVGDRDRTYLYYVSFMNSKPPRLHYYYPSKRNDTETQHYELEQTNTQIFEIPLPFLGKYLFDAIEGQSDYGGVIEKIDLYLKSNSPAVKNFEHIKLPIIIGNDKAFVKLMERITITAEERQSPILVIGDSGTGKELLAQLYAFHFLQQPGNSGTYRQVNLARLPENLHESELFGHEKGAFTGADTQHIGFLEEARNSVIYLDELNSASVSLQAKLLRFLEDGIIYRVGGTSPIRVNVAIVFSVNENIVDLVKQGRLRKDFLYRIPNRFHVPSLAERPGDIEPLIQHFIKMRFGTTDPVPFSKDLLDYLRNKPWSGNIRELKGTIDSIITFRDKNAKEITLLDDVKDDLLDEIAETEEFESLRTNLLKILALRKKFPKENDLRKQVDDILFSVLREKTNDSLSEAVRISGIARSTIDGYWDASG